MFTSSISTAAANRKEIRKEIRIGDHKSDALNFSGTKSRPSLSREWRLDNAFSEGEAKRNASRAPIRPRIVMAGPLPPMVGGMATVINDIRRSRVSVAVTLVLFDTGKKTPQGRPLLQGVLARLRLSRNWWELLRLEKDNTICHIHTCSGLSYFLDCSLMLIARMAGVPVVLHIHSGRFDQFLDSLPSGLLRLAQWLARRAACVVVLSDSWRQRLSRRLPGASLHIIPNGVPMPPTGPPTGRRLSPDGCVRLLFLGNLCRSKGVWELIEAAKGLPDYIHVIFVGGEADVGIWAAAEQAIRVGHLERKVSLVGPAQGDAKHQWFRDADIFVLPSHAEGLPVSMLEAMAAGLPVVVTPVGAIPEVISDGREGLIVPVGDVPALQTALLRLVKDKMLRTRLGAAAQQRCIAEFDIERSAQQYLDMYEFVREQASSKSHHRFWAAAYVFKRTHAERIKRWRAIFAHHRHSVST